MYYDDFMLDRVPIIIHTITASRIAATAALARFPTDGRGW